MFSNASARIASFLLCLITIITLSGSAYADVDVERMQKDIIKELVKVAQELAKLDDAKNEAPLKKAQSILKKMDSDLDKAVKAIENAQKQMDAVKYKDKKKEFDEARETWLEYERYIDAFGRIGPALVTLKRAQFVLDKIPGTCEKAEADQDKLVAKYLKEENTDGIEDLPDKYERIGRQIGLSVDKAKGMKGKLTSAFNRVKGFNPSGREWDRIESEVEKSAQKILAYWTGMLREVHKECDEIAKGEDDPDIETAVKKLEEIQDSRMNAAEKLTKSVEIWGKQSRGVIRQDCQAMEDIWRAYCGSDWEPNEEPDKAAAARLARVKGKKVADGAKKMLAEAPKIEKIIDDLDDEEESKKAAESAKRVLKKYKGYFEKIKKSGSPRGSAHPKTQQAVEFGKKQHSRMENSYDCDVKDAPLEGSRGRPDCIKFDGCEVKIVEFKPNEKRAISKGKQQLANYLGAAKKYYNEHYEDNSEASKVLGGTAFTEAAAECREKDGELTYKGALGLYNMCENTYECIDP